jgi:hypothetical protein
MGQGVEGSIPSSVYFCHYNIYLLIALLHPSHLYLTSPLPLPPPPPLATLWHSIPIIMPTLLPILQTSTLATMMEVMRTKMRTIANVRSKPQWQCDNDGDVSHSSKRRQHNGSYNTTTTAMLSITTAVSTTWTTFTPMVLCLSRDVHPTWVL